MKMFYNGRHYSVMFILTMQAPLGITPELRNNIDYIFVLFNDYFKEQKKIHEHYAGMFPNFDLFRQVFLQLTEDFGAMVIVNRGAKRLLTDKIFYFKANNDGSKKVGCSQLWKFHDCNYDPKYNLREQKYDLSQQTNNKPTINVKKIKRKETETDDS